ncbi:MAG: Hsp70 family protein [Propionibacteriaceae bacterium]|nr:Hsp70 family protein [Propionibacteriaceae bacterium]MDO4718838.1 Hsp70 family protein [Propionibacteriaceae bacterium]
MRVGVDFGTTRTIAAIADRGNYPVASFTDADGDTHDYLPSAVAWDGTQLHYGFEALSAGANGAAILRSFKRALSDPMVGPGTMVEIGDHRVLLRDLLAGYLGSVREALVSASNLGLDADEALTAVVAVPAHARSAQRFLTIEAFRAAGFDVIGVLNEPSAAGFEYTHRQARTVTSKRTRVLVYDLGGGTFDASLVSVCDTRHEIIDSVGVGQLGGDDFDAVLATLAAQATGTAVTEALLEDARVAKEQLMPQSKRVVLEVGGKPVIVPVSAFYEAATPLVNSSLDVMERLVTGLSGDELADVAGIYLVGGGSCLPLVPRVLRERFGRRVHRSPHPGASTAIGLAIAADDAGFALTDKLSRGFGVFRELSAGEKLSFDPIFSRTQPVTPGVPVEVKRRYRAAHNIGWFRFVEYSDLGPDGEPTGNLAPFADVLFAFDPTLRGRDLSGMEVVRRPDGPLIEETYTIDRDGVVSLTITDLDNGHTFHQAL